MVDHQRAGWAKVRVRRVVMRMFRRKIAARRLNVSASALRRQWAQGKASAAAENSERHLGCVTPTVRLPRASPRAKRMAGDNKVRALINPGGRRELMRIFRRKVAARQLNVSDSALPRQWA